MYICTYTRPCEGKPIGKSLRLRDEHGVCLVRQLVRAQQTANVANGGFENAVICLFMSAPLPTAMVDETTDLTVLPEWSRVKSTVAVWLTAWSKRSYTP